MRTIEDRHSELLSLKGDDNWSNVRSEKNFVLKKVSYTFGDRNTYVPTTTSANVNLQDSRGNRIDADQSLNDYLEKIKDSLDTIEESDDIRIKELGVIFGTLSERGYVLGKESLCEIGFRNPRLLQYYRQTFANVRGYDISEINVKVGESLGFSCKVWDLNNLEQVPQDKHDVVLCYHVLEHTYDPVASLKSIKSVINPGGLIHIEIPVEPGTPRLKFGHLIALEAGDLEKMLTICGFDIVSYSRKTHTGGTEIERISAISR